MKEIVLNSNDEFEKLNAHLEVIMEENKVKLEEEEKENQEDFEITNDEIEENLETFIIHNFGNKKAFEDFCKSYNENEDLDKRKFCLQDFNSKINRQLGIFGDLQFSQSPNMEFENSFTDDGYYLTEEEVKNKDLKPIVVIHKIDRIKKIFSDKNIEYAPLCGECYLKKVKKIKF